MATSNVEQLIEHLHAVQQSSLSDIQRKTLVEAMLSATTRLERPMETIVRLSFVNASWLQAFEVADKAGWFEAMANAGDKPCSVKDIAANTGAEEDLTLRLMRHLAAMGTVEQVGPDAFLNAPLGQAMAAHPFKNTAGALTSVVVPGLVGASKHFLQHGLKSPLTAADTPVKSYLTGGQDLFDWARADPEKAMQFMNMMSAMWTVRTPWVDIFPSEDLVNGAKAETPLMVDIGGNQGEHLEALRKNHPLDAERCGLVLQDQAHVVAKVEPHTCIKAMAHDFFEVQPVKGARMYYLSAILHDWSDEDAVRILKALRPALERGYSKLLINESILPETNASAIQTSTDLMMMTFYSSRERSEAEMRMLLERSGFRLVKVWRRAGAVESIAEAELA